MTHSYHLYQPRRVFWFFRRGTAAKWKLKTERA
nr:MAG TPA: hypothetical protein [Bacteriophage sp.]